MRKKLWVLMVLVMFVSLADTLISSTNTIDIPTVTDNNVKTLPTDGMNIQISTDPIFKDYETERFVAHRGLSEHAPENTMPAFELAGKAGFWGIESDIIETLDGVFMCMHDDDLDRTTTGTGAVLDYTYSELMSFNVDYGNDIENYPDLKIPTMIEFLNMCVIYDCIPIIEIKKINDHKMFIETIENSGLMDRCIVTGGIEDLKAIRALNSTIPLMVIGYGNKEYTFYTDLISQLPENSGILYDRSAVTEEVVREVKQKGLMIGVWTLDTSEEARQYLSYGVDYVVTNNITGLNHMINENE